MKQLILVLLCGLFALPAQAQTFQDYIAQFPDITSAKTWQDSEIASLPATGKALGDSFANFTEGHRNTAKAYPLGKVMAGNTVIVFLATESSSYNPKTNTQISVDAFVHNKKTGKIVAGGLNFYFFSVGGDPETHTFMYTGKVETDGKTWAKVYQTGTGSAVTGNKAYKISSKGLSFDKEF